jgi:hypothetical protein
VLQCYELLSRGRVSFFASIGLLAEGRCDRVVESDNENLNALELFAKVIKDPP